METVCRGMEDGVCGLDFWSSRSAKERSSINAKLPRLADVAVLPGPWVRFPGSHRGGKVVRAGRMSFVCLGTLSKQYHGPHDIRWIYRMRKMHICTGRETSVF